MGKVNKHARVRGSELRRESTRVGEAARVMAREGERLLKEGDYSEARKLLTASLEHEADPEVMYSLSCCLLELSHIDEAKQHLVRSCELSPDTQPDKWLSLSELENGKESLQCLEKAIELIRRQLEALGSGKGRLPNQSYHGSAEELRRKLSSAHVCVAELYLADLCDEPNAEECCLSSIEKAIELDPENPEALQARAEFHFVKGRYDVAKEEMLNMLNKWLPAFERAVDGKAFDASKVPPFNVRLASVKLLLELDMIQEAITVLDGLMLEDEDCVDVWYLLGWANYLRGKEFFGRAKSYLGKAAKVAKEFPCDDEELVAHIEELLEELKDVESDDEDDGDVSEDWETDEEGDTKDEPK